MNPIDEIATELLDILPNPVLVKDSETRYVWVNKAFEELFEVQRQELFGRLDKEVFSNRQVAQCNGGDLRVLETGELDEAYELVVDPVRGERETITRKIRQTSASGEHFLLGIMHDVTEVTMANRKLQESAELLQAQAKKLAEMANTDSLTGCLNRRAIYSDAKEQMQIVATDWALMMLDIDHFKAINDRFGHDVGDAALRHFVHCTRAMLRDYDMLGRIGGEEFAVVLPRINLETAEAIALRICNHVESTPLMINGNSITMTVSVGLNIASDDDGPTVDAIFKQADQVLYQAKTQGRNCVVIAH
jgi:diguanylate cyclase (GGDEF)-like protein/PAS domain S-box-containing protein